MDKVIEPKVKNNEKINRKSLDEAAMKAQRQPHPPDKITFFKNETPVPQNPYSHKQQHNKHHHHHHHHHHSHKRNVDEIQAHLNKQGDNNFADRESLIEAARNASRLPQRPKQQKHGQPKTNVLDESYGSLPVYENKKINRKSLDEAALKASRLTKPPDKLNFFSTPESEYDDDQYFTQQQILYKKSKNRKSLNEAALLASIQPKQPDKLNFFTDPPSNFELQNYNQQKISNKYLKNQQNTNYVHHQPPYFDYRTYKQQEFFKQTKNQQNTNINRKSLNEAALLALIQPKPPDKINFFTNNLPSVPPPSKFNYQNYNNQQELIKQSTKNQQNTNNVNRKSLNEAALKAILLQPQLPDKITFFGQPKQQIPPPILEPQKIINESIESLLQFYNNNNNNNNTKINRKSLDEAAFKASLQQPKTTDKITFFAHTTQIKSGGRPENYNYQQQNLPLNQDGKMNQKLLTEAALAASLQPKSSAANKINFFSDNNPQQPIILTQQTQVLLKSNKTQKSNKIKTDTNESTDNKLMGDKLNDLRAEYGFENDFISVSQDDFVIAHGKMKTEFITTTNTTKQLEIDPGGLITPSVMESTHMSPISTQNPSRNRSPESAGVSDFGGQIISHHAAGVTGDHMDTVDDLSSLKVTNINDQVNLNDLYKLFPEAISISLSCYEDTNCEQTTTGTGTNRHSYVLFLKISDAKKAIQNVNGTCLHGNILQVGYRQYSRC